MGRLLIIRTNVLVEGIEMKYSSFIFIILVMIFLFCSCGVPETDIEIESEQLNFNKTPVTADDVYVEVFGYEKV